MTFSDQGGADWCEEMDGQSGVPEREMLVTSQLRATAALQMRLPRKPLPPQTMSFFFAVVEAAVVDIVVVYFLGDGVGFLG